jgi:predicted solute-binding protein
MVFGVWAARSDWAASHRDHFQHLSQSLAQAVSIGLGQLFGAVVSEAKNRTDLELPSLERYFQRQLNYELSPSHMAGLEQFNKLCRDYHLL